MKQCKEVLGFDELRIVTYGIN